MFFGNINFISKRQNWVDKDCILKGGKMMPGGLSGADWSWVGGLVLVSGQAGSGQGGKPDPGRKRPQAEAQDKTNRESWMPADPPFFSSIADFLFA